MRIQMLFIFALAGCSRPADKQANYKHLVGCEMLTLVAANYLPEMKPDMRKAMQEANRAISRNVIASASGLGKTAAEIETDKRETLLAMAARTKGPNAEADSRKMTAEAEACTREAGG